MTIQIVALELNLNVDHTYKRYFKFDLDDGKNFCYRSRTSHDAFFHSTKKRNRKESLLYTSRHEDEHQLDIAHWHTMMKKYSNLTDIYAEVPVVHVKNLWEFYKLIGYDYKTKKFGD
jgi:hypothetical protein